MVKKTQKRKQYIPSKPAVKKELVAKLVKGPASSIDISLTSNTPSSKKKVLHVGCGSKQRGSGLHPVFKDGTWEEIRLDIDASMSPDVVADMVNMPHVPTATFEAVYSSHNIEHIYSHEVPKALAEFFRVLKPGGFAFIGTPDLQKVAEFVAKGSLETPLYKSPIGDITALDVIYGFRKSLQEEGSFMGHKTGFTARTLADKLEAAGFGRITVKRDGFHLQAAAYKVPIPAGKKAQIRFEEPDVNELMRVRDAIDKEPLIWSGFPPQKKN